MEFAGTLRDFVRGDLSRKYYELMPDVEVVLLQSAQSILTQFGAGLQQRALAALEKGKVNVRLGVRVIAVTQDQVCTQPGLTSGRWKSACVDILHHVSRGLCLLHQLIVLRTRCPIPVEWASLACML